MSLIIDPVSGDPVHKPKRRDVFEFDEEVAQIFENMAVRSIPMYAEMHRYWCSFVKWLVDYKHVKYPFRIIDVGSSRGTFYKMLCHVMDVDQHKGLPLNYFWCDAIDVSEEMVRYVNKDLPWVDCHVRTVQDMIENSREKHTRYNIVVLSYVLQFIGGADTQYSILESIRYHCMKQNSSYAFIGMKDIFRDYDTPCEVDEFSTYHYRKFRLDNGYTEDEIDVKTEALRNSMHSVPVSVVRSMLRSLFSEVIEVTRWGNFSGYICKY